MQSTPATTRARPQAVALELPIEKLPFTAYRLAGAAGQQREGPSVFLSLNHWFEAEKFRPYEPELFQEMAMQPTIKEARKLARKHQTKWRFDWPKVRNRVLACGLMYAARADRHSPRWLGDAGEIAAMLRPLDLPEPFLESAARDYIRLRDGPKVVFLGAGVAPSAAVGRKINAIHRRTEAGWTLAHWQGRYGCWRVHDWAVAQILPIVYIGEDDARLTQAAIDDLAGRCQQAVVFERKGGKTMDRVLRALRAARKTQVEIDLFDPTKDTELSG
jgi:hypothetical protein